MKHIAFLSLSLVGLSGGAGLGLSALHEFNMDVQTSALATPDNIPANSGFVIPDHVPDAAHFAAISPSLPAPQAVEAPLVEPVQTAALGDTDLNVFDGNDDVDDQDVHDDDSDQYDDVVSEPNVPQPPAVTRAPVAKPAPRRTGDDRDVVIRAAKPAPRVVTQSASRALAPTVLQARLDYVIGVYR